MANPARTAKVSSRHHDADPISDRTICREENMLTIDRRHFVSGTAAAGALMASGGFPLRASTYTERPELPAALSDGARQRHHGFASGQEATD